MEGRHTTPFPLAITEGPVTMPTDPPAPGVVIGDRQHAQVHFPGSWALQVDGGHTATVHQTGPDPLPTWVVDGWAIPIAALQRGYLCLHASVVDVGGTVVAVGGDSGAGKSTTAAALTKRGHRIVVDDTAVVDLNAPSQHHRRTPNGTPSRPPRRSHNRSLGPMVLPFSRPVHLTDDTATLLNIDVDSHARDQSSGKHLWYPTQQPQPVDPVPLDAIVVLVRTTGALTTRELTGARKVASVARHAGRRHTATHLLGPQGFFDSMAQLCDTTPVWLVERPHQTPTVDAVADAIEALADPDKPHKPASPDTPTSPTNPTP